MVFNLQESTSFWLAVRLLLGPSSMVLQGDLTVILRYATGYGSGSGAGLGGGSTTGAASGSH